MMPEILLIGGSSSVGKSTAALSLSEYLGWPVIQFDHYLPKTGDGSIQLFPEGAERWDLPSHELCQRLITVSERAAVHVESLIFGLGNNRDAIIIEGEAVHPRLAEKVENTKGMSSLFIIESNPRRLYKTLANRSSRFLNLSEAQRQTVVETDQLFGLWLRDEAQRRNVPWVRSQPWHSLCARILRKCRVWQTET